MQERGNILILILLIVVTGFTTALLLNKRDLLIEKSPEEMPVPAPPETTPQIPPVASTTISKKATTTPASPPKTTKKEEEALLLKKLAADLKIAEEKLNSLHVPEPAPKSTRISNDILYDIASKRVVNFICGLGPGKGTSIATGVIISENGYVLTNAHVAWGEDVSCTLRRGSPATSFAVAHRVVTPPNFSPHSLDPQNLKYDVSLWRVDKFLNGASSSSLANLAINSSQIVTSGQALATFSYPAEFLGAQAISSALYLAFSETIVAAYDAHFIESKSGLGSQKGSSGGILLDESTGNFAGLIFAVSDDNSGNVSERYLLSLTPYAINEAVRSTTGKSLNEFLQTSF